MAEGPRAVINAHPVETAPMNGVEAVALDEKKIRPSGSGEGSGSPRAQVPSNRKYGNPKVARAPKTASMLEASSEKNQTPGTPSTCTYVRTLSSCD